MKTIIENVIKSGRYELSSILKKIDTFWVQGDLTDDERTELVKLAQDNAKPENSYAPLQDQINDAFSKIDELKAAIEENACGLESLKSAVESLSGTVTTPEPSPEPEPEDEWPEYVQPTGAHDAYNTGDKISFNGNHYICQMNSCVWSPADYPAGWEMQ